MLHALEYIAHALSFLIKGSRGPTRRRQRRPPHLAQASIACSAINFSRVGSRSPALAAAMMRFANAERIVPASSGFVSSIAWVANQASPKTLQSTKRLGIVRRSGKHRTALHNSWKASALRFGGGMRTHPSPPARQGVASAASQYNYTPYTDSKPNEVCAITHGQQGLQRSGSRKLQFDQ